MSGDVLVLVDAVTDPDAVARCVREGELAPGLVFDRSYRHHHGGILATVPTALPLPLGRVARLDLTIDDQDTQMTRPRSMNVLRLLVELSPRSAEVGDARRAIDDTPGTLRALACLHAKRRG